PTPRWLSLARAITDAEPLPPVLHTLAAEVSAETNETTAIGAPAGTQVVFLDVVESTQPIRYFARIGDRVPIHASSAGRALLALHTLEERQSLYRKIAFDAFTNNTPLTDQKVEAEINAALKRGYHQSDSEYVPDLAGVALPLSAAQRRLCIVVAGPSSRCLRRRADIADTIQRRVKRHARALSL
ncbi:MAG TPA: IclR family transcriptional regulator C-terminal domain-containing protein, partial [Verrucomicrobiae bacterium]|nr:IclR family transcriptional regulator C-terminal domain-containing protein [Verrucomicrobiae bacterium]